MNAPAPLPPRPAEALKARLARLALDPRVRFLPEAVGLLDDLRRFVTEFDTLTARVRALETEGRESDCL